MKKGALIFTYLAFILLLLTLFVASTGTLQTLKYVLLIVAAFFLFRIAIVDRKQTSYHTFNYLFMAAIIVFALYSALYKGDLYPNIVWQFFVASIVGLIVSIMYTEPQKRVMLKAPQRPTIMERKVSSEKVVKKAPAKKAKKVIKKKAVKKATKKKVAKKSTTKKKAVKKAVKKKPIKKKVAKKKVAKKKAPKKVAKKTSKKKTSRKVARRTTTTVYK